MGNWNSGSSRDDDDDDFGTFSAEDLGFDSTDDSDDDDDFGTFSAEDLGFDSTDDSDDDNYYSSDTYSGTFDTDTSVGDDKDDTTTGSLPSFLDYTTSTTTAPDSDGDGIPDTIDTDSRPSIAPDTDSDGIPDYLDADTGPSFTSVYDPFAGSDYGVGTPQTTTYGQPTSFGDLYDPFAGGSYIDTAPPGDSDADGVPDFLDEDTSRPYDPYAAFQALPSTSFQKKLISNPREALKSFGVEPKKIDTLEDGSQVFTVKVNQKNPISGEVQERSFVYTTGPQGAKVTNLYNVTDENKLGDALGNALGFAAPLAMGLPGRVKVDTKEMMKYATEPSPFKEYDVSKQYYSTSAVSALEKDLFRTTTIETEAERTARLAAEQAERDSDRGDDSGRMTAAEKIVQEATDPEETKDYDYYLRQFGTTTPMSYSPYDVMRGRVPTPTQTAAVGGAINQQDDYLTINAEYVKQMPDAFMRDPAMATNPEEVRAIFAHNRRVKEIAGGVQTMSDGGQAVEPGNVAVVGESGPIVANPEEVTEAESVADNVEKTVPEGTFIINQPAAELMGTSDVKDMLLNAVKELRKQGVDFSFGEGKIAEEDAVSLLVSKGEIMVHPLLAKVIGIGRLNKINNRGKAEVEKRIAENGQSPEAEQAQAVAAYGGAQAQGSQGNSPDSFINVRGEYGNEDFSLRPSANYSERSSSTTYPDGAVVDDTGKNIGFALDGEMFLKDDRSLRAGIQRQASQSKRKIKIPEEFGGDTIEFKSGHKMKRYNMGVTFGDLSADVSKQQGSNQPISGRVQYKFSPSGEVFIEGTEGGRSGRVGLNYRF